MDRDEAMARSMDWYVYFILFLEVRSVHLPGV